MNTEPEIEEATRRHNAQMAFAKIGRAAEAVQQALDATAFGLPPVQISREDRLLAARIEARDAFDRGDVGEAYRILSEAI